MHHPTDRIAHTTAFATQVVGHWLEREIAQCVHPMMDRSDDPSHHERTLLPQSYISLLVLLMPATPYQSAAYMTLITIKQVPCDSKYKQGERCSSELRASTKGAKERRIDPSLWTHWAIFRPSQCSTTGVTNIVVCVILSVLDDAYQRTLLLIGPLSEWSFPPLIVNKMCWVRR